MEKETLEQAKELDVKIKYIEKQIEFMNGPTCRLSLTDISNLETWGFPKEHEDDLRNILIEKLEADLKKLEKKLKSL